MAEPRLLQVGNEETTAKEKGDSGLSSAQVGTEAKTVEKASEEPKGVYVANENVVNDNSKALRTSKDTPKGRYVAPTERLGGFERSAGEKGVVNTITVDEVKALIKQYGGGSSDTYTKAEIDAIVETIREGIYVEVDTTEYPTLEDFLASVGEQGTVYLYPIDDENHYEQYIWEVDTWISLGSTEINLSDYYKKSEDIVPPDDNSKSIGSAIKRIKDIHLAGKIKDGTNEFNADNVFNVINASDITNNTLTANQVTLINNGKRTRINGELLSLKNPILETCVYPQNSNSYFGIIKGGNMIGVYSRVAYYEIYPYQDAYKIQVYSNKRIELRNIADINGKEIPAHPTTNTSPQVLTIGANGGNLYYGDDWNPASVSLSDGGTISDTTLQNLIKWHRPIVLNGFTCYFSCDDGTNYQYTSMRYDANANKNHINVITINKSTWVATFHTSDIALN